MIGTYSRYTSYIQVDVEVSIIGKLNWHFSKPLPSKPNFFKEEENFTCLSNICKLNSPPHLGREELSFKEEARNLV